jgi:hypothetical protein
MGTTYIQGPDKGKAEMLLSLGGTPLDGPLLFLPLPEGDEVLVCVVSNTAFEAAAIVGSYDDLKVFSDPSDTRPKTWLLVPRDVLVATDRLKGGRPVD